MVGSQATGVLPIAYSSLAPLATWREGQQSSKSRDDDTGAVETIVLIAASLGVSEARLLLRYALQKGWCVLPKSAREARITENCDLFDFEIPHAELDQLDALDADHCFAFGQPGAPLDPTKAP